MQYDKGGHCYLKRERKPFGPVHLEVESPSEAWVLKGLKAWGAGLNNSELGVPWLLDCTGFSICLSSSVLP